MATLAELMREAADAPDPASVAEHAPDLVRAFPAVYCCFEQPHPRR